MLECSLETNARIDMKLFYENKSLQLLREEEWRSEKCEQGQMRKHPTDCSKYVKCSFGTYNLEQSCSNGLHFNEVRLFLVFSFFQRFKYVGKYTGRYLPYSKCILLKL